MRYVVKLFFQHACSTCGNVASNNVYNRILLSSHGVFIVVRSRIKRIFTVGLAVSLVHRHRIHRNFTFVPPKECQRAAVGRPSERIEHSKFLLIHPVGYSIDYFVFLAIACNLDNATVSQVLDIDIIVHNVCHASTVGRHRRDFLATSLG